MSKKNLLKKYDGQRVALRFPTQDDAEEFIANSIYSKSFHKGLVNPPQDQKSFTDYLHKNESDSNVSFLIVSIESNKILGTLNLSQIFYGGFKNAYLGYYLFKGNNGKGYMTEAVKLLLNICFNDLKLHRLEANIQPNNLTSISLVKRCGFTKEGFSPKYLQIDGKWRDHERWAIIKENWLATK